MKRVSSEPSSASSTRAAGDAKSESPAHSVQAFRETVESVVIAVILAFLFRGFVAEAFVIPTGSMAPTLQGRHIDPFCPECQFDYRTGASEENDWGRGIVVETFCPICRYPFELVPRETVRRAGNVSNPRVQHELGLMRSPNLRSFNGDRILVSKFAYELASPERWDVVVFKYPGNAKQNYIKRLVGLPNELIRIRHGNIYSADLLFTTDSGIRGDEVPEGSIVEGLLTSTEVNDALRERFRQHGITLGANSRLEVIDRQDYPFTDQSQDVDTAWYLIDDEADRTYLLRSPESIEATRVIQVFSDFQIARKPPSRQLALLQVVHDTAYSSPTLKELGWPTRWQDRATGGPAWQTLPDGSGEKYEVEAGSETAWLRYRHIIPTEGEWDSILATGGLPDAIANQEGTLICDYYAYNDRTTAPSTTHLGDKQLGSHWVSDLAVEAEVDVQSIDGEGSATLTLDLVAGGVHFYCELDLATGQATLRRDDGEPFVGESGEISQTAEAATSVRGPGRYKFRFSNVDDQLRLWVNGKLIEFDGPTTYASRRDLLPQWSPDDPGDLAPVGIGARHAKLRVDRLSVWRDVYYLAIYSNSGMTDYRQSFSDIQVQDILRTPQRWPLTDLFTSRREVEFLMGPEHYFPLGDNSPQSQDGRRWGGEPYFEHDLLIGKALFIYWPHAWRSPIPYLPNFQRMGFIR